MKIRLVLAILMLGSVLISFGHAEEPKLPACSSFPSEGWGPAEGSRCVYDSLELMNLVVRNQKLLDLFKPGDEWPARQIYVAPIMEVLPLTGPFKPADDVTLCYEDPHGDTPMARICRAGFYPTQEVKFTAFHFCGIGDACNVRSFKVDQRCEFGWMDGVVCHLRVCYTDLSIGSKDVAATDRKEVCLEEFEDR